MDQQGALSSTFGRVLELMYELRVGAVMTSRVVTVSPDDTMHYVKELMRLYRISGTPVVENEKLVGVVSIEDVIKCLEEGAIGVSVKDRMAQNVVSVGVNERAIEAVHKFTKFSYGRLPVIDRDGRLVGIVTKGDIANRLVTILEKTHDEEEKKREEVPHVIDALISDDTRLKLRYKIKAKDFERAGEASSSIKKALQSLKIRPDLVRRLAIAAYEAEMNLVIHSDGGFLTAEVTPSQVTINTEDVGPGIEDVEQAMRAGYSTAPDWVREMGFGAGIGLTNIRNCADEFRLISELGKGTTLAAVVYLRGKE